MPAYDYETQEWVTDPIEALELDIKHAEADIKLLGSDKAQRYLNLMGYSESPSEALAMAKLHLEHTRLALKIAKAR